MPVEAFGTLDVRPGDQDAIEQVERWFHAYQATGDLAIRERIILAHLGLADRLAARFRRSHGVAYEDLVQAARVGLVSAVNRYNPGRANPFIVYATVCISGELKRYLRDSSWCLHIARPRKEQVLQVVRARDEVTTALGRSPTATEIAARLGRSEGCVLEAMETIQARYVVSLDTPIDQEGTVSLWQLATRNGRCGFSRASRACRTWSNQDQAASQGKAVWRGHRLRGKDRFQPGGRCHVPVRN